MADNARQPKPGVDQSWYKRWPRDEIAETSILKVDEYGALQRYRDYSLIHGGLEDDIASIIRIGATFQLSKYKVSKLWNTIEKFFVLRDGRFFYEQDEHERDSMFVISCKRQLAGRLGAAARWSERNKDTSTPEILPSGLPSGLPSNSNGKGGGELDLDPESTTGVSAAAASTRGHDEAAAAAGPTTEQGPETPPPQELSPHEEPQRLAFEAVSERCRQLGMPIPSPDLAHQVVKKFPGMPPADIAASLPKFPNQVNAALWLHKSPEEIQLEAERQQSSGGGGSRKPTAKEQHQREMLDEARRVDQERAKAKGGR